jgi:hypothetical protein
VLLTYYGKDFGGENKGVGIDKVKSEGVENSSPARLWLSIMSIMHSMLGFGVEICVRYRLDLVILLYADYVE